MAEHRTRTSEILAKFRQARNKRQVKDELWKELDAFDRNEQWDLKAAPPWLPKPVTNYIHLVKYTKRAAFAVENPTAKLRPFSPSSMEAVKLLNKAYEDTFDRIKARKVIRESIETMKLLGTSIAHVYWDEVAEGRMGSTVLGDEGFMYTGEIKIESIEPSSFFPDPNAFTLEDCDFVFIRKRKPLSWIKSNPKFNKKDLKKEDGEFSTAEQGARGEIYLRNYTSENQDDLIDFTIYYEREANDEGGFSYFATYLVNDKIILDKEPLRPNRYPFAVGYDFKQRQDFWAMSTCQFILDNQKIINKVESIIAMIGTLLQNPQRIVSKDSGINPVNVSTFGNAPGQTWSASGDPRAAIHYVQPPQIPVVLFNMLEQAKANIREITGLTESYMGQNVGSLQTSSGVQALIDRATMRDRDQMYDIELYVEEMSKLIIDFMCTYYEEERLIRIIDKATDDIEFIPFIGTDFKDLAYDMSVDVSSKAPITRMREAQEAKELLNLQGQYGANYPTAIIKPQEAVEMMNLIHGQRMIERMNTEELQNKTEQAMQVAQMIAEAQATGVAPDEIEQMAMAMFEQIQNPQAAGTGAPTTPNPQNIPQGG